MEFIDLKTQHRHLEDRINKRINKVLEEGHYIMLGIGAGDEVITTAFSFFATAEVIALLGAKPVFVDIDERTFNINPSLIEDRITEKTRAIMPVSLFGQPADMDEINAIAEKAGLPVVEDAAQSFGATCKGKKSGNLGTIGCTSFFPAKPLGCYGDGGACFTNDDSLAEIMRSIRVHGKGTNKYDNVRIGLNSRLDTLQATILLEKLAVYPDEIRSRQAIAERYTKKLATILQTPFVPDNYTSVWAQYTLLAEDRSYWQAKLTDAGIPSAVYYPRPLHQQPALTSYMAGETLPVAEYTAQHVFSLPIHPYLTREQQAAIVSVLMK
ncbi:MAG: aminotransferase DegT [Gammaproteobacteria bacterium]|nr:MAG: aminotransferase DegT [Gammaproteobacteria bacterium]